jgi:hypothetical protein
VSVIDIEVTRSRFTGVSIRKMDIQLHIDVHPSKVKMPQILVVCAILLNVVTD